MMDRKRLIPSLERLTTAMVGCVGDIMLDRFVYGDAERISPEAPIPVLRVHSEKSMLGGIGNVVRNLGALGSGIRLFSIIGADSAGSEVRGLLDKTPNCDAYLLVEYSRKTPLKVRYIAHSQQLLRADNETTDRAAADVFGELVKAFEAHVSECSVVFLSDYAKGVLAGSHAADLIRVARAAGKPVVVDPKGRDFERYAGATVIKPNLKELGEATGISTSTTESQETAARVLLERTGAEYMLLTRGSAGMLLVPKSGSCTEFPSLAQEVYDVSGAGDTVAAVLSAALGSGVGMIEAVELANIAAGIVVGKVGTAVADRSEILREIEQETATATSGKILDLKEAAERVRDWRRMGKRVGVVADRFDPVTPTHLETLEQTREHTGRLIAALTGSGGGMRELLLASLIHVDAVVVCETAAEAYAALDPDLRVEFADEEDE